MAIMDELTEFADALTVAHAAGTVVLGDQVDLGTATEPLIDVDDISFVITVDTDITVAASTGTIQFQLVSDSTASIATDGSATVHYTSPAFATAATATGLAAGQTLVNVRLPKRANSAYERYLGVLYIVGTTTTNAGKVNAFLTPDYKNWMSTPDAQN